MNRTKTKYRESIKEINHKAVSFKTNTKGKELTKEEKIENKSKLTLLRN